METYALNEDKEIEGQVIINLYTDRTFSIGTSINFEDTLNCLIAAANSIINEDVSGLDELKAFFGKHH